MSRLYTVGFTKKSAGEFFELLSRHGVKTIIDVRLRPESQLSGFAKGRDLAYFAKELIGAEYVLSDELSPTDELLNAYRADQITWNEYGARYLELLRERKVEGNFSTEALADGCLLCSEPTPRECHRRLAAEYLKPHFPKLEIWHL